MRAVLIMIAISISDLSASILKVHNMWNGDSETVVKFMACAFVIGVTMDVVDFFRRMK